MHLRCQDWTPATTPLDSGGGSIAELANERRINLNSWYTAKEAENFLPIGRDAIKRRLREKDFTGEQRGPHREWCLLGSTIQEIRKRWKLEPLETAEPGDEEASNHP